MNRSFYPNHRLEKSPQKGFTLVEVLVAIAIFAVLSAAGWKVFDQLIKTRERNAQHAVHLMQLQTAYAQLLRDLNQAVPIAGQELETNYPALELQAQQLRFNRAGVIDPLQQNLDAYEFVEYRFDQQKQALVRSKLPHIYRQNQQVVAEDIILAPIENLQFLALDPAQQDRWPAQMVLDSTAESYLLTQLPKGIEVKFQYQGRDYRWVYSLVAGLPNSSATSGSQTNGTENPTGSGAN